MGYDFQGIYNIWEKNVQLFIEEDKQHKGTAIQYDDLNDPALAQAIGEKALTTLNEELELVEGVYPSFDQEAYLKSQLQPVFFGSALNNFGVQELLNCFIDIAPAPLKKQAVEREIDPTEKAFSGFVFKIHANMDPNHRDRLAFIKIVSGTFERNKSYLHVRNNKKLKFSSPNAFFAEKKRLWTSPTQEILWGYTIPGILKLGIPSLAGKASTLKAYPVSHQNTFVTSIMPIP